MSIVAEIPIAEAIEVLEKHWLEQRKNSGRPLLAKKVKSITCSSDGYIKLIFK